MLKALNKKSFTTVEGILDEENMASSVEAIGGYQEVISSKFFFTKSYAITKFLGRYNYEKHNLKVDPKTLYLGCDIDSFIDHKVHSDSFQLKTIIYIGRLKKRKGIYDFLNIAKHFPDLSFKIYGDGEEREGVEAFILLNKLNNVQLMGVVTHEILAMDLKEIDLHILPSRSEGFPKVTLETAAAGVPSIVYGDYGANEWITTGKNGWVVSSVEQIIETINNIIANKIFLNEASSGAIQLAANFNWKERIKDWEQVVISICR